MGDKQIDTITTNNEVENKSGNKVTEVQEEMASSIEIMDIIPSMGMTDTKNENTEVKSGDRDKLDKYKSVKFDSRDKTVVSDVREVMVNTCKVYVEGGESPWVVAEGIKQKILEFDKQTSK